MIVLGLSVAHATPAHPNIVCEYRVAPAPPCSDSAAGAR